MISRLKIFLVAFLFLLLFQSGCVFLLYTPHALKSHDDVWVYPDGRGKIEWGFAILVPVFFNDSLFHDNTQNNDSTDTGDDSDASSLYQNVPSHSTDGLVQFASNHESNPYLLWEKAYREELRALNGPTFMVDSIHNRLDEMKKEANHDKNVLECNTHESKDNKYRYYSYELTTRDYHELSHYHDELFDKVYSQINGMTAEDESNGKGNLRRVRMVITDTDGMTHIGFHLASFSENGKSKTDLDLARNLLADFKVNVHSDEIRDSNGVKDTIEHISSWKISKNEVKSVWNGQKDFNVAIITPKVAPVSISVIVSQWFSKNLIQSLLISTVGFLFIVGIIVLILRIRHKINNIIR